MNRTEASCSVVLSILGVAVLCVTPFIMLIVEQERGEAIFAGLFIGSIVGSVLGIIAMILNKDKRKVVYVMSAIPMVPLVVFLLMAIPYYLFK